MPKVYVVGGHSGVERMFMCEGWEISGSLNKADLFCFTGGADVCPALYGEKTHRTTHFDLKRDLQEIVMFTDALNRSIPMAGICRGGQFLNVMCGGSMYQDVDGHAIYGTHVAERLDEENVSRINVTSTHHQMMMPSDQAIVIMKADTVHEVRTYDDTKSYILGIEAAIYHHQKCLCFQPHPEFPNAHETREVFFSFINKYLKLKVGE